MFPPTTAPAQGLQSAEEVLHFASTSLGAIDQSADRSRAGSPHQVRLLATRSGSHFIAKWFDDSTSYFRSLDAMNHHTIPLGTQAPRLIAHDDRLKALLMTHLPGEVAGDDTARDPVTHFQVGKLLRQFHESSRPKSSEQFTYDLASKLLELGEQLGESLGTNVVAELRELALRLTDLGAQLMKPVHGGVHPHHLMVHHSLGIQVFSFSNTGYGPWVSDTAELELGWWRFCPQLKEAFFAGYESEPSTSEKVLIHGLVVERVLNRWQDAGQHQSGKRRIRCWANVEYALGGTLF